LYNHRAITWKNVESYMNEICPILTGGYCQLVSCIHLALCLLASHVWFPYFLCIM
ncbi:hypothetical protein T11_1384, partial [Trichinella zimbabwensis]